jgi:hypothetical protein
MEALAQNHNPHLVKYGTLAVVHIASSETARFQALCLIAEDESAMDTSVMLRAVGHRVIWMACRVHLPAAILILSMTVNIPEYTRFAFVSKD